MKLMIRAAGLALVLSVCVAAAASAQVSLVDLLGRHGIEVKSGRIDRVFDSHAAPLLPVAPGAFATPLALLVASTGADRIDAAYTFAILAGPSGRAASPEEVSAVGHVLILMVNSEDKKTRVAGARVAGRLFAAPFDGSAKPEVPNGLVDAIYRMLNQGSEVELLAGMDALGLLREPSAVISLTDRYYYHREEGNRALAGGALEALARIADPSTVAVVQLLSSDKWAEGKDSTALAVAFARERLLKDGSIAVIRAALDDKSRRDQARGYLAELGAPVP